MVKEAEVAPGRMKAIRQTGGPATAPRSAKPVLEHCGMPQAGMDPVILMCGLWVTGTCRISKEGAPSLQVSFFSLNSG